MKKKDFKPINSQFSGKKWVVRILLFGFYSSVLTAGGMMSAIPDTANLTTGFIGAIAISVISIPIIWATRNMFEKRHLQYGFYLIVIMLIGGHATTKNAQVEEVFFAYYTDEVVPGLEEFAAEVEEGDIPYTNTEEARTFITERFPKYWTLWEQMRQWSFVKTTSGILFWPLLIAYVVSFVRCRRLKREQPGIYSSAQQEATPPDSTIRSIALLEDSAKQGHGSETSVDSVLSTASNQTLRSCSNCGGKCEDDFLSCPFCGKRLKPAICPSCDVPVEEGFEFCPYCGGDLPH